MNSASLHSELPLLEQQALTSIVGFCRPIVDLTIVIQPALAEQLLDAAGLAPGVSFSSDAVLAALVREAELAVGSRARWSPGGPVSNALHSAAVSQGPYPRRIPVTWAGRLSPELSNRPDDPISELRRVGVATRAITTATQEFPRSLCLLDADDGETIAIVVGTRDRFTRQTSWANDELLLCQLDDLSDLLGSGDSDLPSVALMTADATSMSPATGALIETLASRGRLHYIVGRRQELESLGLLGGQWEALRSVEIVATDGPAPVQIYRPLHSSPLVLPTSPASGSADGSYLGAGDAYTGSYLAARLGGHDAADAHDLAVSEARLTSYEKPARSDYSANLSSLFGALIERTSDGADWHYFHDLRQSAGLTVISCGNTGVDAFALQSAARWGLAAVAVMPSGKRREGNDAGVLPFLPPEGTHCLELASQSYRFCTWSNVYLSDGTVLLDIAGGEGSAETRRAAHQLNRPLFELSLDDGDPLGVAERLREWARSSGVRVVNIAGSRGSTLDDRQVAAARSVIDDALRTLAGVFARSFDVPPSPAGPRGSAPLGIPALREVSSAVWQICDTGTEVVDGSRELLSWTIDGLTVVRAKSRDIVRLVADGTLDAGLVGGDMVLDSPEPLVVSVMDAGVFNCLVALIEPQVSPTAPSRIVAQYPHLAMSRVDSTIEEIVPVGGSAEGWVHSGLFDAAVDTWRTGRTAAAHGLRLREEIARTSLRLVCRPDSVDSAAVALGRSVLERMTLRGAQPPAR